MENAKTTVKYKIYS